MRVKVWKNKCAISACRACKKIAAPIVKGKFDQSKSLHEYVPAWVGVLNQIAANPVDREDDQEH